VEHQAASLRSVLTGALTGAERAVRRTVQRTRSIATAVSRGTDLDV